MSARSREALAWARAFSLFLVIVITLVGCVLAGVVAADLLGF